MDDRIYLWHYTLTNILTNEYFCQKIFKYIQIPEYLLHTVPKHKGSKTFTEWIN